MMFRKSRLLLPLAAALFTGCAPLLEFSRTSHIVHSEPRPVAPSSPHLIVEATPLPVGRVRLCVSLERTGGTKQEYWREAKGEWVIAGGAFDDKPRGSGGGQSGVYVPGPSTGANWNCGNSEVLAVIAVALVGAVVAGLVVFQIGSVFFALATWAVPFDEQRTMVFRATTERERCVSAVIESPDRSERFELGLQPDGGYIIQPEMLLRLGRPGASVVIRSGEMSASIELPR